MTQTAEMGMVEFRDMLLNKSAGQLRQMQQDILGEGIATRQRAVGLTKLERIEAISMELARRAHR